VLGQFLAMCSHLEDFDTYRRLVRDEITSQLRAVESTALTAVADRVRIPIKIQPVRQTQHV
jgi:4-hydroxyphenylpyruvate dioxygenase-like putative hemolysin